MVCFLHGFADIRTVRCREEIFLPRNERRHQRSLTAVVVSRLHLAAIARRRKSNDIGNAWRTGAQPPLSAHETAVTAKAGARTNVAAFGSIFPIQFATFRARLSPYAFSICCYERRVSEVAASGRSRDARAIVEGDEIVGRFGCILPPTPSAIVRASFRCRCV